MAKSIVAFILLLAHVSTAIKNSFEQSQAIDRGNRLCRAEYGSYYYDEVYSMCCPCSSCNTGYGPSPDTILACWNTGDVTSYCRAPYYQSCKAIGDGAPPPTQRPPRETQTSTTPDRDTLTSTTLEGYLLPATGNLKEDRTFSTLLIVGFAAILFCLALVCICACYLVRSKKLEKGGLRRPKWLSCSSKDYSEDSSSGSVSDIISGAPLISNGIHPSSHTDSRASSVTSQDGPPELIDSQMVQPDTSISSCGSQEPMLPSTDGSSARHVVRARMQSQDGVYPSAGTTISGCNNVGVVAAPASKVIIHNLNVHYPDPNNYIGLNITNQQIRVRSERCHRTFPEPIEGTESWPGRHEHALNRQSSEISSNSSGPVENEAHCHDGDRWNNSVAREDQVRALRSCSQKDDQSINDELTSNELCRTRCNFSYPTMSSDVSSYASHCMSSVPPQGDVTTEP